MTDTRSAIAGRVAAVTGAGSGFGRAVALRLALIDRVDVQIDRSASYTHTRT